MLMSKAQQKSGQSKLSEAPLVGRFAPTPSGFLHLGNVFCSLLAWLYAKKSGGKIVLRIEDLDPQRCSLAKADALARELEWLGLTWDEGAYVSADSDAYFQSRRSDIYAHYFDKLRQADCKIAFVNAACAAARSERAAERQTEKQRRRLKSLHRSFPR